MYLGLSGQKLDSWSPMARQEFTTPALLLWLRFSPFPYLLGTSLRMFHLQIRTFK